MTALGSYIRQWSDSPNFLATLTLFYFLLLAGAILYVATPGFK